jgi:hypothetical protein
VAPETTLQLDRLNFIEPDFCVFDRALDLTKLDGSRVRLAVPVAAQRAYDLGRRSGSMPRSACRRSGSSMPRRSSPIHRRLGAEG